jgi:tetratricopeptide (TPR) repeat protein
VRKERLLFPYAAREGAEQYLKKTLEADPQMAQAAYNLCIITANDRLDKAIGCCRKPAEPRPQEPKYGFTLSFYLNRKGNVDEASRIMKSIIEKYPQYKDAAMLLRDMSEKQPTR